MVHWVVGATVWAMYMPDAFFGMTMTSPWLYSLLYNGFYMLIDTLLCLVIFALLLIICARIYGVFKGKCSDLRPGEAEIIAQAKKAKAAK